MSFYQYHIGIINFIIDYYFSLNFKILILVVFFFCMTVSPILELNASIENDFQKNRKVKK